MPILDPKTELNKLPKEPGVYKMLDKDGKLLYVGKAKRLDKRVRGYFEGRHHGPHIKKMAEQIASVEVVATGSENDAFILEQRLINALKPKYNIIFRDDKTYPFIKIHAGDFPQASVYRGEKKNNPNLYGPYPDSYMAKAILEHGQKIFGIRSCPDSVFKNRSRACVEHQIGRCCAPCVGLCSKEEYQSAIQSFKDFVAGKDKQIVARLTEEMNAAAQALQFEKAAALRDKIRAVSAARAGQSIESADDLDVDVCAIELGKTVGSLHFLRSKSGAVVESYALNFTFDPDTEPEMAIEQALLALYAKKTPSARLALNFTPAESLQEAFRESGLKAKFFEPKAGQTKKWLELCQANAQSSLAGHSAFELERIKALEKLLKLQNVRHIECFDISHYQSEAAYASCVVWRNGALDKKSYRKFGISPENAGDDFGSMKEAIVRRYNGHLPDELPDLLLIDGGPAQMKKAKEALDLIGASIPMLGIAKGVERKLGLETMIPDWGPESFDADKHNPGVLLLALIRDESHRFAIAANRKKTAKNRSASLLAQIPGVGPARRKALLLAFGSAAGVRAASLEDLKKIPGIDDKTAKNILNALNGSQND